MANKFFELSESGDEFIVHFENILADDDSSEAARAKRSALAVYDAFDMTAKKTFRNIVDVIDRNYNDILVTKLAGQEMIFDECSYFVLHLLDAKHKIDASSGMPMKEFLELIDRLIEGGNGSVMKLINFYVDSHYTPMEQSDIKKYSSHKELKQIAISDEIAKQILCVSYFQCLITPIISEYIKLSKYAENESEDEPETENICDIVFDHIIDKCVPNPSRLKNKLYKIVESRVTKMMFTGRTFWEMAASHGMDPTDVMENIYKKLITATLYKIDINQFAPGKDGKPGLNVVGFLQSIVNNQLRFTFGFKFNETLTYYNPATGVTSIIDNDDDEDMAIDIVEGALAQKDEGALIMERLTANAVTDSIPKMLGVSATDEEVNSLIKKKALKANPIQESIVSLMTFKYYHSTTAIKLLSAQQYSKVLLACSKWLSIHNYAILSKVLLSDCYVQIEKENVIGNKVRDKIKESKNYKTLFKKKYGNYQKDVEAALLKLSSTIYSSKFVDSSNHLVLDESIKPIDVINETIDLAYMV